MTNLRGAYQRKASDDLIFKFLVNESHPPACECRPLAGDATRASIIQPTRINGLFQGSRFGQQRHEVDPGRRLNVVNRHNFVPEVIAGRGMRHDESDGGGQGGSVALLGLGCCWGFVPGALPPAIILRPCGAGLHLR